MPKKSFILVVFILFFCGGVLAQEQKVLEDSMMHYYKNNQFEKAVYWGELNAEAVKQKSGESDSLYATAINNLAQFNISNGNYKKAKPLLIKATTIYRNVLGERDSTYLFVLKNLGTVNTKLGEYAEADSCIKLSMSLQKEFFGEQNLNYATTLNELALLAKIAGRYTEAENLYKKSLSILKVVSGEEDLDYLRIFNNLATLYYQTGKYALTEKIFIEVVAIKKRIVGETHLEYASSLNNLGAVYYVLGNYQSAEPNFYKAMVIYKSKLGEKHPQYASVIGNLGALYQKMAEFSKAEPFIKQQIQIFEASIGKNTIEYAGAINNLAYNNFRAGKDSSIENMYKEALEIRKILLGKNHFEYIQSLSNLALYYTNKKKFLIADSIYKEAIQIQENNFGDKHPDYLLFAHNQTELYQLMHNYKMAAAIAFTTLSKEETLLINKLNFLSESELISHLKSKEFAFSIPYSSLLHINDIKLIKAAYNNCLLIKGLSVQNFNRLTKQMGQLNDSLLSATWKNYQINKALLSKTLGQSIIKRTINTDSLNNIANQQEKELLEKSANYRKLKENQNISWEQIHKNLLATETAVEFVRFRYIDDLVNYQYHYAAMLLNPHDSIPIFIKLFDERDLKIALNNFVYRTSGHYNTNKFTEKNNTKSKTLYQLLWQPLLPYLSKTKTIYFAPDGLLQNIAFAALPTNKETLLSDKYNLIQLTSTRQIVKKENENFAPTSITLFGGINYNKQNIDTTIVVTADPYSYVYQQNRSAGVDSFTYLPNTLKEVESIKRNMELKQNKVSLFTNENATEAAFRNLGGASSPRVIHFATHGFTVVDTSNAKTINNTFKVSDNPLLRSGLVLSGGNKGWQGKNNLDEDDGILTALEITTVQLQNTQLAVLSACETGTGELRGSEGIFGLQRAFKLAGVNYVMASLWQVPDKETSEFMNTFYSNWLAGKTIRMAFTTTQQTMRKKYAPFYWAGFTLVQ